MSANSTVNRSRRCLTNGKDVFASYRKREEQVRQAREKHDEERIKKIDDFKQASLANQRYRGQFEEQRKRRFDDVRTHNNERQNAVLERRRQILEAEKDRREALLRMKLERAAKLEANKNAQRNAMSAFGSGLTPRWYESYGMSDSQSTQSIFNLVLPTSRRSASLYRNFNAEDLMTKSRTSLLSSSFFCHGRRKTDLTPTLPNDVSTLKQKKDAKEEKEARKAELEQICLAEEHRQLMAIEDKEKKDKEERQDRRKALFRRKLEIETKLEVKKNAQRDAMLSAFGSGSTPQLNDMNNSLSMFDVVLPANVNTTSTPRRPASLNRNFNAEDLMTKSCTSLPSSSFFGRRKTDLTPTLPKDKIHHAVTPQTRPSNRPAWNLL